MKFILGEKKEMTQKFAEDGTVIPVTKVLAEPLVDQLDVVFSHSTADGEEVGVSFVEDERVRLVVET